ncbi:MAG: beta-ketoacyl-ACP synthase II [Cystobacterineae bacterium]|nr:beta-ketoacyl-ACP synthase II [Cystobacterineae bacterium]
MSGRRVVITGTGLVTSLGTGTEKTWNALLEGKSGIDKITRFEIGKLATHIAGEVRDFVVEDFVDRKEVRRMDLFCQYALAAAQMAVKGAGFSGEDGLSAYAPERVGAIVGSGIGGFSSFEENCLKGQEKGWERISPYFIIQIIANMAPGLISIRYNCKGPNWGPVSACSTGAHAIGEAYRAIVWGEMDAAIAGGSEAPITRMGIGGFSAMKALSTRNEEPQKASRPFDRNRDGFVMGEGSGIVILEEMEQAKRRGANIVCEVIGYAASSDAFHVTQPAPEGEGATRCMKLALSNAKLAADDVDYINAHGTSTPYNDVSETRAIRKVFGSHAEKLMISSTKSMLGHTLGAAGSIESIISALTVSRGIVHPTINLTDPDPDCDLDYVPNEARKARVRVALSNSFGFGGTNVVLAFRGV